MTLLVRTAILALAIALPFTSPPASASDAPRLSEVPDTIPVMLSISGGISRGAYMAGVNWVLVEVIRRSQDREFRYRYRLPDVPYALAVATGASAGNVNATLSAVEYCTGGEGRGAEESLFWSLWTDMGWDQLFAEQPPGPGDREALFTRRTSPTARGSGASRSEREPVSSYGSPGRSSRESRRTWGQSLDGSSGTASAATRWS